MKRKYYYGFRILHNFFRAPIRMLLYYGRIRMPLVQVISPKTGMRVFGDGFINIYGRLTIEDGTMIEANGGEINITSCFINRNTTIVSMDHITIEKGVTIGPGVAVYDHDHNLRVSHSKEDAFICAPVKIEKNAWIGANAVILKGVTVGEGAAVAAGAVVNKDVEPYSIVGGIPAKTIGNRLNQ